MRKIQILIALCVIALSVLAYPAIRARWRAYGVNNNIVADLKFDSCGTNYTSGNSVTLTTTRNSAENYECGFSTTSQISPSVFSAPANTPTIWDKGLGVWNSYTQTLLHATDPVTGTSITSPWISSGATLATGKADPSGGTTASQATWSATTGWAYIGQGFTGSAVDWAGSVYLKAADAETTTVYIGLNRSGTCTTQTCTVNQTNWSRCSVTKTLTAATYYFMIAPSSDGACNLSAAYSAASVYFYLPTVAVGAHPSPAIGSTTTTVSVPASDYATSIDLNKCGGQFCITWSVQIDAVWGSAIYSLGLIGTDEVTNFLNFYFDTNRTFFFNGKDSSGARVQMATPAFLPASVVTSPTKITTCFDKNQTAWNTRVTVYVDDGKKTVNNSIIDADPEKFNTLSNTVYIGGRAASNTKLNGYVKSFKACCGTNYQACQ